VRDTHTMRHYYASEEYRDICDINQREKAAATGKPVTVPMEAEPDLKPEPETPSAPVGQVSPLGTEKG